MKNHFLPGLIGVYLLFTSLSLSVTGCGKKGDLVRPVPGEQQQSSQDDKQTESGEEALQDDKQTESNEEALQDDKQTESSEEALQDEEQTESSEDK